MKFVLMLPSLWDGPTKLNGIESTLTSELVEIKLKGSVVEKLHSLDKKLFCECAKLAKHLGQKGKQQITKEWTQQLTKMPMIKPRKAQA